MSATESPIAGPVVDPLAFRVSDVTGIRNLDFEGVDGHRSAGDVAASLADHMDLPTNNMMWSLRDEQSARMLREDQPLGGQVQSGARLVLIPKSQLG